jgi:hypothetical protein
MIKDIFKITYLLIKTKFLIHTIFNEQGQIQGLLFRNYLKIF